jgi:hypothetical protein
MTFHRKRRIIEVLIYRVVVAGEEVEIRYVIPTGPKGELVRFHNLGADCHNEWRPHLGLDQHSLVPLLRCPSEGRSQCRDYPAALCMIITYRLPDRGIPHPTTRTLP